MQRREEVQRGEYPVAPKTKNIADSNSHIMTRIAEGHDLSCDVSFRSVR